MNTSTERPDADRVRALLLARLLPSTKRGPSRKEVLDSIATVLAVGRSRERAQDEALAAWKHCVAQRWMDEQPAKLTAAGRARLCQLLDLTQLPELKTWTAVQRDLLQAVALGRRPEKGNHRATDIAAEVIQAVHGLPRDKTLRQTVDRLAWRTLGLETDLPFQASSVQRHVLRGLVPSDARLAQNTFRRLIAGRALDAPRTDGDTLRRAALNRWLSKAPPATKSGGDGLTVTANDNAIDKRSDLAGFAAAVLETARKPSVTRFHDDRAFIGSIWEHMRGRAPILDMTLADFKEKLVQAHREKLLRMSRADLVQAMDPTEVRRSEARYLSATFHFVSLQTGGAS